MTRTTTPDQSGPESNGNVELFYITQSFRTQMVKCHIRAPVKRKFLEMQSAYSTAQPTGLRIICLHSVILYQLILAFTNNLHTVEWFQVFLSNMNNST